MTPDNLIHQLLYAWEPNDKPDDGFYHIYDKWLSTLEIKAINDNKYLCGIEVSDPKQLSDFTNIERQTGTDSALHNALCPTCKELMDQKFSLVN